MAAIARTAVLACALLALSGHCAWSAPDEAASADRAEPLQEVTVTAHRLELEKRVSKYVYQIATLVNGEGIPRWRRPVCPLVAGLPKQEGEFALERISEVARDAAIPLAEEHCGPNLLIFVTPDPERFLAHISLRTRDYLFAGAHPGVIDEFIRTPRPVRAWYKAMTMTPQGKILGFEDRNDTFDALFGSPAVRTDSSHTRTAVVWGMSKVLVVVDQKRLAGVSRGQFADYMAMVGLAQIKPGTSLGDAPSILKLFEDTPQAAPEGMSTWDQAFLKAVYATDSTSKGQRGAIQHAIMNELAH